jgi:hypothetical protein
VLAVLHTALLLLLFGVCERTTAVLAMKEHWGSAIGHRLAHQQTAGREQTFLPEAQNLVDAHHTLPCRALLRPGHCITDRPRSQRGISFTPELKTQNY